MHRVLFVIALAGVATPAPPPNPCPGYLEYARNADGTTGGKLSVPNDYSGDYLLAVNASLPYQTQQRMSIVIENYNEISMGPVRYLIYGVKFGARDTFPKLTRVVFNGRTLCFSQPYELTESGVTNLWAESTLEASIQRTAGPSTQFRPQTQFVPTTQFRPLTHFTPTTQTHLVPTTRSTFAPTIRRTTPRPATTTRLVPPPTRAAPPPLEESCGTRSDSLFLIIQGQGVEVGEFPWMAALFNYDKGKQKYSFLCTSNLLSLTHIITAGHCVQYESVQLYDTEDLMVVMGKTNLENWAHNAHLGQISRIEVHPRYQQGRSGHDLAILVLSKPIHSTPSVRPLCVWSSGPLASPGVVAGWGQSSATQLHSKLPNKLTMPIVSSEVCVRSHPAFVNLTSAFTFCGGARDGSGPCRGDSGSAFMVEVDGRWRLRGIVSYALATNTSQCDLENYVVFADVTKEGDWINSVLNEQVGASPPGTILLSGKN